MLAVISNTSVDYFVPAKNSNSAGVNVPDNVVLRLPVAKNEEAKTVKVDQLIKVVIANKKGMP